MRSDARELIGASQSAWSIATKIERKQIAIRENQIIDVLENPQLAEDAKILATPTLIKRLPPPLRRVIGDLSDKEKVLLGLDVWPDAPSAAEGEKE